MSKTDSSSSASTVSFVSVNQCRLCGSIIPFITGVDRHKKVCRLSKPICDSFQQMVTVTFPCPVVCAERISISSEQLANATKLQSIRNCCSRFNDYDDKDNRPVAPPRRKSSLRALEILKWANSNSEDDEDINEGPNIIYGRDGEDKDFRNDSYIRQTSRKKPEEIPLAKKARTDSEDPKPKSKQLDKFFNFKCSNCTARFRNEAILKRHEYCVHGDGSKGRKIFTCPICQRMFHTRLIFQSHLKSHESAEAIEEAFDLWNKWPSRSGTRNSFTCSCKYCVVPLKSHKMFLNHMKTDHSDKDRRLTKYSCSYCTSPEGQGLDSMKLLIRHIQTSHAIEYIGASGSDKERRKRMVVQCKMCPKKVKNYYLEEHMKRRHSNTAPPGRLLKIEKPDNPYACPVDGCGAKLKMLFQLKQHFLLHLENNPYACPFPGCNVRCDAKCHLNRHMELHVGKGHPCKTCGLIFARIDKLRLHKCDDKHPLKTAHKAYYDKDGNLRSHFSHLRLKRFIKPSEDDTVEDEDNIQKDDEESTVDVQELYLRKKNEKININAVIASDPVFIQVSKENPGFADLLFNRTKKPRGSDDLNRKFKCAKCSCSYYSLKTLRNHEIMTHVSRPFQCSYPDCERNFMKKHFLQTHLKTHELNEDNDKEPTSSSLTAKKKSANSRRKMDSESDSESDSDPEWDCEDEEEELESNIVVVKNETESPLDTSIIKIEHESQIQLKLDDCYGHDTTSNVKVECVESRNGYVEKEDPELFH